MRFLILMMLFYHLFTKYLLRTRYTSGTVCSVENNDESNATQVLCQNTGMST